MNNNQSSPKNNNRLDESENEAKESKLQRLIDMARNPDKYSESRWDMQPGDILVTTLEDALERRRLSIKETEKFLSEKKKTFKRETKGNEY